MAANMLSFFIVERNNSKKSRRLKYYMMKEKSWNSGKKITKKSLHV